MACRQKMRAACPKGKLKFRQVFFLSPRVQYVAILLPESVFDVENLFANKMQNSPMQDWIVLFSCEQINHN